MICATTPFDKLAERQILKAQAEGALDHLEGEGKPLSVRPHEDAVGIGMRIMAEAGMLPREFELKKAVDKQFLVLQATTGALERKAEMKKLADLTLRLEIEREARRSFFK
ncbi:DUF1992 domain-containing protein [Rhodovulum sulfidophilum]|uniref:DnaJ family domain-containing protein n=1 Tax=Rhodovulum sulfidophilum TaxID=35806 RepID=UPI001922B9AB|nr:DnaJ family domain-containing protein [Rhodovulum sulfidophilum]MBL3596658.1 DUF1992 domain-containing protein [Rhodovulum sulfidophilum]